MEKYFTLPDTEELVTLYADDVLRVCNYYLGKRSLAEDAFQDVFVKVIRKRDSFGGDCPPKYWLLTIAKNVCKDYLKSTWATRTGSFEQMNEDQGEKAECSEIQGGRVTVVSDGREQEDEYFDRTEPQGELWDAIQSLPAPAKDVVLFKYYCDMDNTAIAKVCGITESTVRSRLFRVRKKLARFEKKMGRVPGEAYEESV